MICDDCPNCGKDLEADEDIMMSLFSDPFNGVVVMCDCGAELSLDIMVTVEEIVD